MNLEKEILKRLNELRRDGVDCTLRLDKAYKPFKKDIPKNDYNEIIMRLIDKKYITGLNISSVDSNNNPQATVDENWGPSYTGKEYMVSTDESKQKTIDVNIKNNVKIENEHFEKIVALLSENSSTLNEIKFLKADQIEIMKLELERLSKGDTSKKIPWDTLINVLGLITNITALMKS